jgi:hypothetical protein
MKVQRNETGECARVHDVRLLVVHSGLKKHEAEACAAIQGISITIPSEPIYIIPRNL